MIIPPELIAAKDLVRFSVLALPGVVGIGVGLREENGVLFDDELAIRIHVSDKSQIPAGIPEVVRGFGVSIIETLIEPLVLPDEKRYNPIVGGIKIAKPSRGDGTLGAVVQDSVTGELLGLSCFHVVGDVNASFPDTIWQPTNPPLVVGTTVPSDDNIGHVVRVDFPQTQPLPFSPVLVGLCDAAVFTLIPALNQGRTLSQAIIGQNPPAILIDRITATALATELPIGIEIRKRGFSTLLTEGRIIGASTDFQWTAGPINAYIFDQAEIIGSSSNPDGKFCIKGDSGSIVLLKNSPTAVGLLWGGTPSGIRGVMSSIRNVESQLGVNMVWL